SARPARTGSAGSQQRPRQGHTNELPRVRHRRLCGVRPDAALGPHRPAARHCAPAARRTPARGAPHRSSRPTRPFHGASPMNPTRRRRLWFVLAIVAASALVAVLVAMALQRNVAYLFTPAEILDGRAGADVASGATRFRLGGMVADGSLERTPGSMEARFMVSDGDALMPVVFSGILPDLFRENQSVVATGRMRADGTFVAE